MPRLTRIVLRLPVSFKPLNKESYSRHDTQNRARHTELFNFVPGTKMGKDGQLLRAPLLGYFYGFLEFYPVRLVFWPVRRPFRLANSGCGFRQYPGECI